MKQLPDTGSRRLSLTRSAMGQSKRAGHPTYHSVHLNKTFNCHPPITAISPGFPNFNIAAQCLLYLIYLPGKCRTVTFMEFPQPLKFSMLMLPYQLTAKFVRCHNPVVSYATNLEMDYKSSPRIILWRNRCIHHHGGIHSHFNVGCLCRL